LFSDDDTQNPYFIPIGNEPQLLSPIPLNQPVREQQLDFSSPRTQAFILSLAFHQITYTPPAKEDYAVDAEHIQPESLFEDP